MNFRKVQRKNRKAISPVLATVILIAITLIAAIAIAGFVFGLFGSFTSSFTPKANVVSCTPDTTTTTALDCSFNIQNPGSTSGSVTAIYLTLNGAQVAGTAVAPTTLPITVSGGTTATATLQFAGAGALAAGTSVTGQLQFAGGSAAWSGTVYS